MASSEALIIGTVVKHRGEYDSKTTYYRGNQVTMYGSVFQAISTTFSDIPPVTIADNGNIQIANAGTWKCIIDNIKTYNNNLNITSIPEDEIKQLFS